MNTVLAIEAILSAIDLGLCLLTISLLIIKRDPQRIYLPLIVLFCALSVSSIATILELFPFTPTTWFIQDIFKVMAFVSLLLLFPVLWFYVRNITHQYTTPWKHKDLLHLIPFGLGLGIGLLLVLLPEPMLSQIVSDGTGPTTPLLITAAILLYGLMVIWVCQSIGYLFAIVRQLMRHRAKLKQYFSSTEHQELVWIYGVAFLLFAALITSVIGLFSTLIDDVSYLVDAINLVLVYILAHWGLRQGSFIDEAQEGLEAGSVFSFDKPTELADSSTKYEKSALSESHIDRIESNIRIAIEKDKLHLNPNLSLGHLATAVGEQPNYVSQTLNGRIGETFFDFINAWRIKEAIQLITETDNTILDITYAAGFNSRSSFYKAFKRETGVTPTAYRKSVKEHQSNI